jgi:hypothetical protein
MTALSTLTVMFLSWAGPSAGHLALDTGLARLHWLLDALVTDGNTMEGAVSTHAPAGFRRLVHFSCSAMVNPQSVVDCEGKSAGQLAVEVHGRAARQS